MEFFYKSSNTFSTALNALKLLKGQLKCVSLTTFPKSLINKTDVVRTYWFAFQTKMANFKQSGNDKAVLRHGGPKMSNSVNWSRHLVANELISCSIANFTFGHKRLIYLQWSNRTKKLKCTELPVLIYISWSRQPDLASFYKTNIRVSRKHLK